LKPERVFKAFLNYRTKIGFVAFPTKDRSTVPNLLTALNEPNLIALVSDRDMSSSGVIVDLLGRKASFPSGPASLAYKTKAALVTVEIYNDGDGIVIVVEPEIEIQYLAPKDLEVKRVTQEIANRFSRHISSHPQDWHVLQRVFLDA
jgi:KDO2-lipid IV(A) lauroyltransferase